jgi:hypothetical protein
MSVSLNLKDREGNPVLGYLSPLGISETEIEENKSYLTESLEVVTLKRSTLPYYKFTVDYWNTGTDSNDSEVWNEKGEAYHSDCKYNLLREIFVDYRGI